MTAAQWATLREHHFPGDEDEHGAVLLCGVASSPRSRRFLVRDVVLAEDGVSYVPGTRGYRQLTGKFVTHQIRRAKDEGLVYLAVHNHGGDDAVGFSAPDLASHDRGYPTLLGLSRQPVGGVVLAERALAADIWLPDGSRVAVDRTVVIGSSRAVMTPTPNRKDPAVDARYDRQALLYGAAGQRILGQAKIGVVGAGGVGMLLVQALARLGVGHLVVIDPERVEPTNLPRLPETTRLDAMVWFDRDGSPPALRRLGRKFARRKVSIARRIVRRANPGTVIDAIQGDVADDTTARNLTDCDFIFLAADTMLARDVVNQIAYQFLIPTLQVGSKAVIAADTGEIRDVYAAVRALGHRSGCFRCNGLIDLHRLGEEALGDPEQVKNQKYVDDAAVRAPSVITLNAMAAGWAANAFMQYLVGISALPTDFQILRTTAVALNHSNITLQEADVNPACHVCGDRTYSAFARGDSHDLPTRA